MPRIALRFPTGWVKLTLHQTEGYELNPKLWILPLPLTVAMVIYSV